MTTLAGGGGGGAIFQANNVVLASFSADLPAASPINTFENIKSSINTYLAGLAADKKLLSITYYYAENNSGAGAVTIRSLWALVITSA